MQVTLDLGGLIDLLLVGSLPDDEATVIGLSRVAYVSERKIVERFLPAAAWHDAAYIKGSGLQKVMARHQVDATFLEMMLKLAHGDKALELEAIRLYLVVRKFAGAAWEGSE